MRGHDSLSRNVVRVTLVEECPLVTFQKMFLHCPLNIQDPGKESISCVNERQHGGKDLIHCLPKWKAGIWGSYPTKATHRGKYGAPKGIAACKEGERSARCPQNNICSQQGSMLEDRSLIAKATQVIHS